MSKLTNSKAATPNATTTDAGAVAPLFAILLGSGFLVAMFSLVIGGGQLFVEKRAVQNAADVVALAIGQHCANEYWATNCLADSVTIQNPVTGVQLAGTGQQSVWQFASSLANPKQSAIGILSVCGQSELGLALPQCGALTETVPGCKTELAGKYPNWLRVYVQSNFQKIGPGFANLAAQTGVVNANEIACSQVVWGAVNQSAGTGTAASLAVAIGACDVQLGKPYVQFVLVFNSLNNSTCSSAKDKQGISLGFKTWGHGLVTLDAAGGQITALDATKTRTLAIAATAALKHTLALPVFASLPMAPAKIQPIGYVPFYLTGFNFFGTKAGVSCAANNLLAAAGNSAMCLVGIFKNEVTAAAGQAANYDSLSTPNFGFQAVKQIY